MTLSQKFALCCHGAATTSLPSVATTLPTDFGKTFISNKLTTSLQSIARLFDNIVTTSLSLLGGYV